MTTATKLAVNFQLAPVTTDDIRAALVEHEATIKHAREKYEAVKVSASKGDTIALLHLADVWAEYRVVVAQANEVYFERIGDARTLLKVRG